MKQWTVEELKEFEHKVSLLFKNKGINCPIHLSGGNEETLIALFNNIKKKDWVFSTHRNHYHYLLKGGSPKKLIDEIVGRESGVCGGNGRSMHIYDSSINFFTSAIIGGTCAIAVGVALSLKKRYKGRKSRPHVWCFIGDGAEDSGHYVEALRFAMSRALPITFIVEDNDLAVESTKKERWHNFKEIKSKLVIRYSYERLYPHVGVGERISM